MRILLLGQGGREHAIYWHIKKFDKNLPVKVAPGNGGIPKEDRVQIAATDFPALEQYVKKQDIDTIIVGPEQPLAEGVVDYFRERNVYTFGPSKEAARLEGSKAYAKEFMEEQAIPTAGYKVFTVLEEAVNYLYNKTFPIVVKASGLAAGKGVSICFNKEEAVSALTDSLSGKAFGDSGKTVVIEDFLQGREASIFLVCDGEDYQVLGTAQDYKRAFDGDEGPNTGGMGAFSPARILDEDIMGKVKKRIIEPTLSGMAKRGVPYHGILYLGLMISDQKDPFVVEYNCRMGDPETQVVLPLLETPFQEIVAGCRDGKINELELRYAQGEAITVVIAKNGYPASYEKGKKIDFMSRIENDSLTVFHAGTEINEKNELHATGGRVLNVTCVDKDLQKSFDKVYASLNSTDVAGFFFRKDIAKKFI